MSGNSLNKLKVILTFYGLRQFFFVLFFFFWGGGGGVAGWCDGAWLTYSAGASY